MGREQAEKRLKQGANKPKEHRIRKLKCGCVLRKVGKHRAVTIKRCKKHPGDVVE